MDADKQGFLRNETSLIQTVGRAARNAEGRVIMYGDVITPQMRATIEVTENRRKIQDEYNKKHGITPKSVRKSVRPVIEATKAAEEAEIYMTDMKPSEMTKSEIIEYIAKLETEMKAAAQALQFEQAALMRDRIFEMRTRQRKRKFI